MNCEIKGILTDCIDGTEKEVDILIEIKKDTSGKRLLEIIEGGVTGYEGFYIDHIGLPKELTQFETDLERLRKNGWLACDGTKNKWDRLFIPPEQMKIVLEYV